MGITSSIVRFPETLDHLLKKASKYLTKSARVFDFTAVARAKLNGAQGTMRFLTFEHVLGIHVQALGIEAKTQLKIQYEKNDWRRKLTRSELEERRNEAKNSQQRASQFAQRAKHTKSCSDLPRQH